MLGTVSFWQSGEPEGRLEGAPAPIRLRGMAHRLISQPKNYDWGVPGALSQILGREPSTSPEAEVWWGNHPLAGCMISTQDGSFDFPTWLEQTGTHFPLLVKLLAAQKPLSIQVHPSEEQAELGFDNEERSGIPLDARERTYTDRSAKPELLVALSDEFVALVGFAEEQTVRDRVERWIDAGAPQSLAVLMDQVAGNPREAARLILQERAQVKGLVRELGAWLSPLNRSDLPATTVDEVKLLQKASTAHTGDSGILFVVLMHHVYLKRGQAVFVDVGEVHAYVEGLGLEVMLPSDNVIRAGLTSKHKDIEAFLELSNSAPTSAPSLVSPVGNAVQDTYEDFGARFVVHSISSGAESFPITRPSVCFVESGEVVVSDLGETLLGRGEAVLALPGDTILPGTKGALLWVVHAEGD